MKKSILTHLFFFSLLLGYNPEGTLSAQWLAQTPPSGTTGLNSIFAISPTDVACAGTARIIDTQDGGVTWNSPISGITFNTVSSGISTSWLGLSLSGWYVKVNNPGGVLLTSGIIDSINSLHFSTPNCATAVGLVGKIETSSDSGATWTTRSFTGLTLNSVWYASPTKGLACGVFGSIKRTLNGGITWATVTCPVIQNLNGVTFADSLTGYIVGNNGTFLKTIDGGATWTSMPLSVANTLNGVYFVSPDTGYVVGTAGLIKNTTNGGVTWTTMNSGTTQILRSVHFANSGTGWVCGDGGTILKYCPYIPTSGVITGNTSVCAGDTLTYYIPPINGATGYTWTKPSGWSGNTSNDTLIVVAGYSSGYIGVAANNACGSGTPVTLAVTVNSPPVPTITQSLTTLTSSATTGNQWFFNGTPISGATSQTYNFTTNGTYMVVVTANGCSSPSLPHTITNAGIYEYSSDAGAFLVYPNPTDGLLQLNGISHQVLGYRITDVYGNMVMQADVKNKQTVIDMSGVAKGIYFIQITDENKRTVNKKIILQ